MHRHSGERYDVGPHCERQEHEKCMSAVCMCGCHKND